MRSAMPFAMGRLSILAAVATTAAAAAADGGLPPLRPFPNGYFWGCLNISKGLPFCDHTLTVEARVKDLVGRLTQAEKQGLLGPDTKDPNSPGACTDSDAGVPRLGIDRYTHLVEDNSGAGAECIAQGRCSTNFPGPTGLAASFNRSLWKLKGQIIATEQRANSNCGGARGYEFPNAKVGLTGFGPNINIARDPRFGRISELPSEDPFLASQYAVQMVKGMQEGPSFPKYLKLAAALKHFDAYSMETDRMQAMFEVTSFDLFDSYLPQYKAGFANSSEGGGGATGCMCSYAGINGVPMCANDYVLNKILRGHWGRPDAHVQSDCGAISNMLGDTEPSYWPTSHYAANKSDAAAKALNGGCDLDDGNQFYQPSAKGGNGGLTTALAMGYTDMAHLDAAVSRVLTNERFRTGLADPLELQPYTKIDASVVNSSEHQKANLDAATQSMVLLKNAKHASTGRKVLPLSLESIAVVGPHAVSHRDLLSDYIVDQLCWKGPVRGGDCFPTVGDAFTAAHAGDVFVVEGISMDGHVDNETMSEALQAVKKAEQVVLMLGIGNHQEHEGQDRKDTKLPGAQEQFAQQILSVGKPTCLVLVNGGIISIDNLIDQVPAIVEAFYPSTRGGLALYQQLSGVTNSWGKLPVTIYPESYTSQIALNDFNMTTGPGRTYRYYKGNPLYEFGTGLSFTTFTFSCEKIQNNRDSTAAENLTTHLRCKIRNTGKEAGAEVLMVYHKLSAATARKQSPAPVFIKTLVEFERVSLAAGATTAVEFVLSSASLATTTIHGDKVVLVGQHIFEISTGGDTANGQDPPSIITVDVGSARQLETVPRPPHRQF